MFDKIGSLVRNLHKAQEEGDKKSEKYFLFEIAKKHYEQGEFEKSKVGFERLLEKFPRTLDANYYIALVELNLDNFKEARKYFDRELKLDPENSKARELMEKLDVNDNFPYFTIILFLLNSLIFFYVFPSISFTNLIKFGFNYGFSDIFSLFTSLFFHANSYHYIFNMFILIMFGLILEKQVGSVKFFIIYIVSGLAGNLFQAMSVSDTFVLGASSALFGMIAAIIIKMPLLKLKLLGFLDVPIILLFGGFFALNSLVTNLLDLSFIELNTGDIAHLVGMLTGFLIAGLFYRDNIEVFYSWLLIFFGFWLIKYSIETSLISGELLVVIYQLALSLIGIFLIIFSYRILKQNYEVQR